MERLGKKGTFVGQHIYLPLHGVAVHINAYNFPVWALLEKLAPALIAGVPVIAKPASQTAFVTQAVVRSLVDSGLLPQGALQLICGQRRRPPRPPQRPGRRRVYRLGGHSGQAQISSRASSARSVRFNTEADSLNSAILGPDATPGTEEFDLFVTEVSAGDDPPGGPEVHRYPPRVRSARVSPCGRWTPFEPNLLKYVSATPATPRSRWVRWSASTNGSPSERR